MGATYDDLALHENLDQATLENQLHLRSVGVGFPLFSAVHLSLRRNAFLLHVHVQGTLLHHVHLRGKTNSQQSSDVKVRIPVMYQTGRAPQPPVPGNFKSTWRCRVHILCAQEWC